MNALPRRRIFVSILLLAVLIGLIFDAFQVRQAKFNPLRFVRRPAGVQTRDDAALLSGWLEQVDNSWEVGKNHQRVRSAFRNVVADARRATVCILRDNRQVALGTIVDSTGYILTKASEVAGDEPIVCRFQDNRTRPAKCVGTLPSLDLAMLKVENIDRLTAAKWNTEKNPPPVGSLLATPHLGREPLAVGVVSLLPQPVANDGVLGIQLSDSNNGPLVSLVMHPSAAEEAGLQNGDLVLRVDEHAVTDSDELMRLIQQRLPGDTVSLALRRGKTDLVVDATLGRRTDLDQENNDFQSFLGGELSFRRSGFASVLQHDTFLLPEHCGGPVCDLEGRVVGVNIARAERIASYALPAAAIIPWLDDLKAGKYQSLSVGQHRRSGSDTADRR
jgi:serine protease Do